ncbi:hypothetical protein M8J75_014270 [Diaphorina citri]|nr:hypothetical protein M8J75_014270 [Diaphorina citri]
MMKPLVLRRCLPNGTLMVVNMDPIGIRRVPFIPSLDLMNLRCSQRSVGVRQASSTTRDTLSTSFSSERNELSKDILLEKIMSSSDTAEIFESIKHHLSIMNPSHQFNALNALFQLEKSGNSTTSKQAIAKSPEFQNLCKQLFIKIHTFRTDDVITMLKCLIYFNVHPKAKILQGALKILASNVNELSLQNIVFLDFLLSDLQTSPLVEALKISLPIVFQAQYSNRVNSESNASLIDMLAFATRKQLSEDVSNKLLDTLVERNNIEYTERNAKSIVMSIANCKVLNSVHGILLKRTLMWISQNLNRFSFDDIEGLVGKLINKYVWVDDIFYHEIFLNSVIDYLIENQHSFNTCTYILKKLARIHFVSKPLLEHMARKAYENPVQLEKINPGASISFVASLSDGNYKPPHWELIQTYILHNFENTFMTSFASLDVYPPFLYDKIFDSHFLDKYVREDNVLDYFQLVSVHQINQTLNPNPQSNLEPPRQFLMKAVEFHRARKEYPLLAALERGLGGKQFVLNDVFTKYYHYIDHLIAMRKGGYAIPLQFSSADPSEPVFLEDIRATLPEGHYMIAICALPASAYTLNTQRLRGTLLSTLKSLETCGLSVIPVHVEKWQDMPDHEKIPYLMQLIRNRESNEDFLLDEVY